MLMHDEPCLLHDWSFTITQLEKIHFASEQHKTPALQHQHDNGCKRNKRHDQRLRATAAILLSIAVQTIRASTAVDAAARIGLNSTLGNGCVANSAGAVNKRAANVYLLVAEGRGVCAVATVVVATASGGNAAAAVGGALFGNAVLALAISIYTVHGIVSEASGAVNRSTTTVGNNSATSGCANERRASFLFGQARVCQQQDNGKQ